MSMEFTGPLDSENVRIALNLARLLDHEGNWTPPFPVAEVITCRGADGTWDHKLFGSSQVHPGDNAWQAMTFCGKRALEIPGRGSMVDCPACLKDMAEDATQALDLSQAHGTDEAALIEEARAAGVNVVTGKSAPPPAGTPYLDGDNIVKNWHHKGP